MVQNGGTAYTVPVATATGGGGSGCVLGTPVLSGGVVVSVPVTTAGTGYTSPPTITITGATGSGAVAVPIMAGVQPTDVVTYGAVDGWLTAMSGAAPAAPSTFGTTAVANYSGQLEAAIGGYLPFNLPASGRTMLVGPQLAWPTQLPYFTFTTCANWIHRTPNAWTNAATSTPDGHPLTITGTASGTLRQPHARQPD